MVGALKRPNCGQNALPGARTLGDREFTFAAHSDGPGYGLVVCLQLLSTSVNIPVANGVAQTTTPAEVEQVRSNAADLVQVRQRVRLRLGVIAGDGERESEDGRMVLRRAAGIADLYDAVERGALRRFLLERQAGCYPPRRGRSYSLEALIGERQLQRSRGLPCHRHNLLRSVSQFGEI